MPTSPKAGARGGSRLTWQVAQGSRLLGWLGTEEGDSPPARRWVVVWKATACLCVLSMIVTPDRVTSQIEMGNADKPRFATCKGTYGDRSCTSLRVAPRCLSPGERAAPGPGRTRGCWRARQRVLLKAEQQAAVTPWSPPALLGGQHRVLLEPPRRLGVHARGADSHLLTVFPKYPDLYRYLKLPISSSALFKRRDVLLENQRFAVNCLVIVSTTRVDLKKEKSC